MMIKIVKLIQIWAGTAGAIYRYWLRSIHIMSCHYSLTHLTFRRLRNKSKRIQWNSRQPVCDDMQRQIYLLTSDYLINCFLEREKEKNHARNSNFQDLALHLHHFSYVAMDGSWYCSNTDEHAIILIIVRIDFMYLFQIDVNCYLICFVQFQSIDNFLSTCNSFCIKLEFLQMRLNF